jgi:hypothetical protein
LLSSGVGGVFGIPNFNEALCAFSSAIQVILHAMRGRNVNPWITPANQVACSPFQTILDRLLFPGHHQTLSYAEITTPTEALLKLLAGENSELAQLMNEKKQISIVDCLRFIVDHIQSGYPQVFDFNVGYTTYCPVCKAKNRSRPQADNMITV